MREPWKIVWLMGPSSPDALQTEHQANERAKLDDLYRAMEIYAETIRRLAAKEA